MGEDHSGRQGQIIESFAKMLRNQGLFPDMENGFDDRTDKSALYLWKSTLAAERRPKDGLEGGTP